MSQSTIKQPLRQLELLLSPFGMKIFTAGTQEVADFFVARYGTKDLAEVQALFEQQLQKVARASTVILGVPNDNGAGFDRGSKKGPLALRRHWFADAGRYGRWESEGIVDIGDVRDHPLVSEDRYLQDWVVGSIRQDRWGHLGGLADELQLPVSCLSILERVLECLWAINPGCRLLMLGGDHSKSLVPVQVLSRRLPAGSLGVVVFDAHTDLLDQRDGLPGSYATWAYHANEAIGRGGRLVQLGVRISGKPRRHWEETLNIHQYWTSDCLAMRAEELADEIVEKLKRAGVRYLYLSNDIDGLDPRHASATGTPEPEGLSPEFEQVVIARLGEAFEVVGSDMMEVAPLLTRHEPDEPRRTLAMATRLCDAQLRVLGPR